MTTTSTRFDYLEKLLIETSAFSTEWLLFQRDHIPGSGSVDIVRDCPSLYRNVSDFYNARLDALLLYIDMCNKLERRMHKDVYLEIIY